MAAVTVIGQGNIGSRTVGLIAQMPGITAVTLVDPDSYEESNLLTQAIDGSALGAPKVDVQSAVIKAINPNITVRRIRDRLENVPVAALRGTTLLSCTDNRRARQTTNRYAWRNGSPWIDAAIDAVSLVRISVFVPGQAGPCLECSWDEASYDLLEQDYTCAGEALASAPPTNAPSELGALAAALQAAELRKLIGGALDTTPQSGLQLMYDTYSYTRHLNRVKQNAQCRFDHCTWHPKIIEFEPKKNTLADLFDALDPNSDAAVSVEGHAFVTYLHCVACDKDSCIDLSLGGRLDAARRICSCGGRMLAPGFFCSESVQRSNTSRESLRLKLDAIGFRIGDLLSVTDRAGGIRHIEIAGELPDD